MANSMEGFMKKKILHLENYVEMPKVRAFCKPAKNQCRNAAFKNELNSVFDTERRLFFPALHPSFASRGKFTFPYMRKDFPNSFPKIVH